MLVSAERAQASSKGIPVSVAGKEMRRKAVEAREERPRRAIRKVARRKRARRYGMEARMGRARRSIWYCWFVVAFCSARL